MKIFLDTNVLLRFYLQDNKEQFEAVREVIQQIESGQHRPYVSAIVLLEMVYVLQKVYNVPKQNVLDIIDSVRRIRGVTILEKTKSALAVRFYQQHNVKFADCLIASQVPHDVTIVTYDREFTRLPIKTTQPQDLLSSQRAKE